MGKINRKEEIMEAALNLFSENGYEATSISQIADAVGIKKASLYFHFESKQDILDSIIQMIGVEYTDRSHISVIDWDDDECVKSLYGDLTPDSIARQVKNQLKFILHDPHVSKFRKMLIVEQYRNSELKELLTVRNYDNVYAFHTDFMKYLIRKGTLRDYDPAIMAAQFAFPISMWLQIGDREPDREEELMILVEKHVNQFFKIYGME